jgi:hypothetical protein
MGRWTWAPLCTYHSLYKTSAESLLRSTFCFIIVIIVTGQNLLLVACVRDSLGLILHSRLIFLMIGNGSNNVRFSTWRNLLERPSECWVVQWILHFHFHLSFLYWLFVHSILLSFAFVRSFWRFSRLDTRMMVFRVLNDGKWFHTLWCIVPHYFHFVMLIAYNVLSCPPPWIQIEHPSCKINWSWSFRRPNSHLLSSKESIGYFKKNSFVFFSRTWRYTQDF